MMCTPRPLGLRNLCNDQRGTIAVMTGLCAAVLAGFTALAIDVASWQVAQRSMQGAADTAAYSAGHGAHQRHLFRHRVFGDRAGDTSSTSTFNGGSNMTITAAVYFPTQSIAYSGGSVSGPNCTQFVADKITITGNAYFSSTCQNDGMANINVHDGSPGTVQVVE
jgi:Flp pilus assembly protein TadG